MTAQQPLRIGVLALQGSFREHMASLARVPGVEAVEVRTKEELASVQGLIIPGATAEGRAAAAGRAVAPWFQQHDLGRPHVGRMRRLLDAAWDAPAQPRALAPPPGGESTTMALVAERWGLIPELRQFASDGKPVWGTCAGLIFLANKATGGFDSGDGRLQEVLAATAAPKRRRRRRAGVHSRLSPSRAGPGGGQGPAGTCRRGPCRRPVNASAGVQVRPRLPPVATGCCRHEGGRPGAAGRAGRHCAPQLFWRAGGPPSGWDEVLGTKGLLRRPARPLLRRPARPLMSAAEPRACGRPAGGGATPPQVLTACSCYLLCGTPR